MPKNYSAGYQEVINATGADEAPHILLEISHPGLTEPARLINDTQDLPSNGQLFVGIPFQIVLPDDLEEGAPRATLQIDNVGRELTQWVESSGGGEDATVRIMQVLRSAPDVIEWEVTMSLSNVHMTMAVVSGTLTYDDLLNRPSVTVLFRPETAPGLF